MNREFPSERTHTLPILGFLLLTRLSHAIQWPAVALRLLIRNPQHCGFIKLTGLMRHEARTAADPVS